MITLNKTGLTNEEIIKYDNLKPAIKQGISNQQQNGSSLSQIKMMINKGIYLNKWYELQKSYSSQIIKSSSIIDLMSVLEEFRIKQQPQIKSSKDRSDLKKYAVKQLIGSIQMNKSLQPKQKEEFINKFKSSLEEEN